MSDTLAQLITKLQSLLLGDSDTFSTTTCTAAIRQALLKLNLAIPQRATETQVAVSEQYEYELEDITALQVVDVLREGLDTYADINISLAFDAYFLDDRPFIRLRVAQATGQTLIIQCLKPYTINGLDGSTDSTMPPFYDAVLLDGAAWSSVGPYFTSISGTAPIVVSLGSMPVISITGVDSTHAGSVPLSGTPANRQFLRAAKTTGAIACDGFLPLRGLPASVFPIGTSLSIHRHYLYCNYSFMKDITQ